MVSRLSSRQVRGGSGQVPGATAASLDSLTDPSDRRTTYHRTYTKPPVGVSLLLFCQSDDTAFVGYPDTLPAIAQTSLL